MAKGAGRNVRGQRGDAFFEESLASRAAATKERFPSFQCENTAAAGFVANKIARLQ
jgi:hypothetical protein